MKIYPFYRVKVKISFERTHKCLFSFIYPWLVDHLVIVFDVSVSQAALAQRPLLKLTNRKFLRKRLRFCTN